MPPPLVVAGDAAEVTIVQRLNDQVILNVLHYRCINPGTGFGYEDQLTDLLLNVRAGTTLIVEKMLAVQSEDIVMEEVRAQVVAPTRRPYITQLLGLHGERGGVAAPQNLTLSITKRPSIAGRGRSGHFQLCGARQEEIENGYWQTGFRTLCLPLAVALKTHAGGSPTAPEWLPITAPLNYLTGLKDIWRTEVKPELRTMHRRTVGLGQ